MTPLPAALGGKEILAWRLDRTDFASTWDSGEGSFRFGGRWNSTGVRAVYCSLDPATAILEVAVHNGFRALDIVEHTLTSCTITDPSVVFVVQPDKVPNADWLRPGIPSVEQQAFGDELLEKYKLVVIPSAVSTHSWNLIFTTAKAGGVYKIRSQEKFALDPRLNPAAER